MSHDYNLTSTELATELTVAWIKNSAPGLQQDQVKAFLKGMQADVMELLLAPASLDIAQPQVPVASEVASVETIANTLASKDFIISLIDGKPYKMLRRHLRMHGMTPEQYRARFGLDVDYPMTAENHSKVRRELAVSFQLGQKRKRLAASD